MDVTVTITIDEFIDYITNEYNLISDNDLIALKDAVVDELSNRGLLY
jgi:hypothetical protein